MQTWHSHLRQHRKMRNGLLIGSLLLYSIFFAMNLYGYLIATLVIVNVYGLFTVRKDKRLSKSSNSYGRIPEKTFWLISICFGSIGVYGAMRMYRHKTQHPSFVWGMPLLIMIQVILIWLRAGDFTA